MNALSWFSRLLCVIDWFSKVSILRKTKGPFWLARQDDHTNLTSGGMKGGGPTRNSRSVSTSILCAPEADWSALPSDLGWHSVRMCRQDVSKAHGGAPRISGRNNNESDCRQKPDLGSCSCLDQCQFREYDCGFRLILVCILLFPGDHEANGDRRDTVAPVSP